MTRAALFLSLGLLAASAFAQDASPAFDVVSIKPNTSGDGRSSMQSTPSGVFTATNVTLRGLIMDAFGVQANQLAGGPDWFATDRFDIMATGSAADGRNGTRKRAMLSDRFHLVTHTEMRDRPVFDLVAARADRRLGPSIMPAGIDCHGSADADRQRRDANAAPCGLRTSTGRQGGTVTGGGRTMPEIATMLADYGAERPVFDKTGITGAFDFELKWVTQPTGNADDVSFFTAIQEQLGLKLEPATAPVEVLVIDRVAHPDAN